MFNLLVIFIYYFGHVNWQDFSAINWILTSLFIFYCNSVTIISYRGVSDFENGKMKQVYKGD